ncbi:hypothetical protein BP6252_14123 [Coleophoma cylindrospora]|uniref:Uncharacterized protein n=1 Tax=Coleophoma cylindrospora TaxID=1849047 RepID=A0A3D8Q3V1_9HELO|nr:hypothetical protein BP6252_14123 [Coleophoma cylindrospora]
MSFGYSVGDFLAVGSLCLQVYKSYKSVPETFDEIGRELCSCHIVLVLLEEQASNGESFLNKREASRRDEILQIRDNLDATLQSLETLFQRYKKMGSNAWERFKLGQLEQDTMAQLKADLVSHMTIMNSFTGVVTMASAMRLEATTERTQNSINKMEPMMREVLILVREILLQNRGRAQSLRSDNPGNEESWDLLKLNLATEGIPQSYTQEHEDEIRTVVDEIAQEECMNLQGDSETVAAESQSDLNLETFRRATSLPDEDYRHGSPDQVSRSEPSSSPTGKEETRKLHLDQGFGMDHLQRSKPSMLKTFRNTVSSSYQSSARIQELDRAAKNGHVLTVRLLLGKGVSIQSQNSQKTPALVVAAANGYFEIVKLLLYSGVEVSVVYWCSAKSSSRELHGLTALHAAAKNGHNDIVKLLLRNNADRNQPSEMGQTPLELSVSERHVDIVQTLLANGASIALPKGAESLLHIAARINDGPIVKKLLRYGANLESTFKCGGFNQTPLDVAVQHNSADSARELLNRGARTDIRGNLNMTPILQALNLDDGGSHVPLLKLLLDSGAKFDRVEELLHTTPVYVALKAGKMEIMNLLRQYGALMTTTWLIAVSNKDKPIMNELFEWGIDLRAQDANGVDALWLMMTEESRYPDRKNIPPAPQRPADIEGLQILLDLGLPLGGADNYGRIELYDAASIGDVNAVKFLVGNGVKFDNTTSRGEHLLQSESVPSRVNQGGVRPIDQQILKLLKLALLRPPA